MRLASFLCALSLTFACKGPKSEATSTPPAVAPTDPTADPAASAGSGSAAAPGDPSATAGTPDPASGSAAAPGRAPLSSYLASAIAAKVYNVTGANKQLVKSLNDAETKAYLAKVDLSQRADGPLVKCPNDKNVELFDATGKLLGTIGYCADHARFDAADGSFGGIHAPLP